MSSGLSDVQERLLQTLCAFPNCLLSMYLMTEPACCALFTDYTDTVLSSFHLDMRRLPHDDPAGSRSCRVMGPVSTDYPTHNAGPSSSCVPMSRRARKLLEPKTHRSQHTMYIVALVAEI